MKKHYISGVSWLLIGSMTLQSCATLISGSKQAMYVSGQPEGSTYYVNDQPVKAQAVAARPGTMKVRLKRKGTSELKIKHEGYKDYNEALTADRPNPVSYLDFAGIILIVPWLVAMGVDSGTGATRKFSKSEIQAQMPRFNKAVAGGGPASRPGR